MMAAFTFASCSSDSEAIITATEDDYPRILNSNLIESTGDGSPFGLGLINRDVNFTMTAIVTPTEYTTVEWFIDGELAHTGTTIDVPLLAGDHSVKIVATTTKGLSTYRNCTISVAALEGDPALDNSERARYFTPGESKTIEGSNIDEVKQMFVGNTEITGLTVADGKVSFTVPQMAEGEYNVTVITASGEKFGCGKVTVSNEPFPEPTEQVLWEGPAVPDWNTVALVSEQLQGIKVGQILRVYYSIVASDYHALRITTEDWSYDYQPQIDVTEDGVIELPVTQELYDHVTAADNPKGFLITGHGFSADKVTVE